MLSGAENLKGRTKCKHRIRLFRYGLCTPDNYEKKHKPDISIARKSKKRTLWRTSPMSLGKLRVSANVLPQKTPFSANAEKGVFLHLSSVGRA